MKSLEPPSKGQQTNSKDEGLFLIIFQDAGKRLGQVHVGGHLTSRASFFRGPKDHIYYSRIRICYIADSMWHIVYSVKSIVYGV